MLEEKLSSEPSRLLAADPGTVWYARVAALDTSGVYSALSNEANAQAYSDPSLPSGLKPLASAGAGRLHRGDARRRTICSRWAWTGTWRKPRKAPSPRRRSHGGRRPASTRRRPRTTPGLGPATGVHRDASRCRNPTDSAGLEVLRPGSTTRTRTPADQWSDWSTPDERTGHDRSRHCLTSCSFLYRFTCFNPPRPARGRGRPTATGISRPQIAQTMWGWHVRVAHRTRTKVHDPDAL